MSNNWKDLEEQVKQLINFDHPVRTPLSGGTKGEEDVVGIHSVSQCKFTADKNISILAKDLERLIIASNMLRKFPLFFNESQAGRTVSIPITVDTAHIVDSILKLAISIFGIGELPRLIYTCNSPQGIERAQSELDLLKSIFKDLQNRFNTRLIQVQNTLDAKRDNLLSYNLFE